MVSTRATKFKFTEGEKVLCYEPDPTKTKVLYDSKVLGVDEYKNKKGRKVIRYKIHFQGWNSSWDRQVEEDYVLKYTEENKQLQKDLAQKAQLQLAAYLYRRERKKRLRKECSSEVSPKLRQRVSSEDGSSCSRSEKNDNESEIRDDCDSESYSSSLDGIPDDERVKLHIGYKIKQILEFDYKMIVTKGKTHKLPVKIPIITILERFVKQIAWKILFSSPHQDKRRRTPSRSEKREKDYEKQINTISILKEVADGLRLYFDFTFKDYLLYDEEKEQASSIFSEETFKNLSHFVSKKTDSKFDTHFEDFYHLEHYCTAEQNSEKLVVQDEHPKKRLRSYKNEETEDVVDDKSKQDVVSSTGCSTYDSSNSLPNLESSCSHSNKSTIEKSISSNLREHIEDILSWQMLPHDYAQVPSMIYGAVHLARLLVKLPDFLNATAMPDDKMKLCLKHLDMLILYLESHDEFFGDHNYE